MKLSIKVGKKNCIGAEEYESNIIVILKKMENIT